MRRGEVSLIPPPLFELLLLGKGTWGSGRKRRRAVFFYRLFAGIEADELCVFVCGRSCESGWEGEMK